MKAYRGKKIQTEPKEIWHTVKDINMCSATVSGGLRRGKERAMEEVRRRRRGDERGEEQTGVVAQV